MSASFDIKGWCPGALRPMWSGDGIVVRVRPRGGELSAAQLMAIAQAAARHGNGLVELTSRANVQIRGVREESHGPLLAELSTTGLIDPDVATETQRNIVVAPFGMGSPRHETLAIAEALAAGLAAGPELPAKFGFAIDAGPVPVLADTPSDVRIERDVSGRLLVRADGSPTGRHAEAGEAAGLALALARWFLGSGGAHDGRGRMARHLAGGSVIPAELSGAAIPAAPLPPAAPGRCAEGVLIAAEFGTLPAAALARIAGLAPQFRVTPWRMLLAVGVEAVPKAIEGAITAPDDPRLRVTACSGSPSCPQALAPTRALARALAASVPAGQHLHVTGCAKGCARPSAAPFTLVATPGGFARIRAGGPRDAPDRTGLTETAIRADPSLVFDPV